MTLENLQVLLAELQSIADSRDTLSPSEPERLYRTDVRLHSVGAVSAVILSAWGMEDEAEVVYDSLPDVSRDPKEPTWKDDRQWWEEMKFGAGCIFSIEDGLLKLRRKVAYVDISVRMKEMRQAAKLSQANVAHLMSVSRSALNNFEHAKRKIPIDTLEHYAAVCGYRLVLKFEAAVGAPPTEKQGYEHIAAILQDELSKGPNKPDPRYLAVLMGDRRWSS